LKRYGVVGVCDTTFVIGPLNQTGNNTIYKLGSKMIFCIVIVRVQAKDIAFRDEIDALALFHITIIEGETKKETLEH
jgi:hypothetical protein